MMGCGEWTTEGCTRLTVAHIAVGEEYGGGGCETVAQLAGLAHEAVLYLHAVDDAGTLGDDGVLDDDSRTDIYVAVNRTRAAYSR